MTDVTNPQFLLYHPSHHVEDLTAAEEFFERVFGAESRRLSSLLKAGASPQSVDYSTFTMLADVLFDSIDPTRYLIDGVQQYPNIDGPILRGVGWYVSDPQALYQRLRGAGYSVLDQLGELATGDTAPLAVGSPMPLFFTDATETGLRFEFVPRFRFPLDPRTGRDWELATPAPGDPLGILRCARHVIATVESQRAVDLFVDVFGATVVAAGEDELLGGSYVDLALGDAVFRYVVQHTMSAEEARGDRYLSLVFEVVDLDAAEAHLRSFGVGIARRTEQAIVVDPDTALGIPWQFVSGEPSRRRANR